MRSHYPVARAESQEIIASLVGEPDYNAYEKDIAIVNIFFGDSTGFGELQIHTFESMHTCYFLFQNLRGCPR